MSWNQFARVLPTVIQASEGAQSDDVDITDVITATTTGARTRTVGELSTRIKQAGGALVVNVNDSDYIVAVNNGLRFSVTRLTSGQFRITESMNWLLLVGLAGIVGVILLSRR